MKCAVTGAAGFIGSNLARRLLHDGHEVHLLTQPEPAEWRIRSLRPHAEIHGVDLGDRDGVENLIGRLRPEWIFHLAVHGAYSWQHDVSEMIRTNVTGTANLVQACAGIGFQSFVNVGSSSEYGFLDRPANEEDLPDPNSYYAVTKTSATLLCRFMAHARDLHIPTLRFYSVYGPYEDPRRLMPTLIVHGLQRRLPKLVSPEIARDFVYVDDAVEALCLAAGRSSSDRGAIYNVASSTQTTLAEIVEIAREELRIDEAPEWQSMANRVWDTSSWVGNADKINRELGWTPRTDLREGFRAFVRWFSENPDLQAHYLESVTGEKKA